MKQRLWFYPNEEQFKELREIAERMDVRVSELVHGIVKKFLQVYRVADEQKKQQIMTEIKLLI